MSLKKGAMYVLIANVINLFISLFTGFVLPKLLSIDTYAGIKLFQLYITYIGILHLGFSDGMYLQYGGKKTEEINTKEIKEEFKTFKLFQLLISIIAVAISLLIKNNILLFCSLVILPINVGNYLRNLYQATGEFKKYSTFTNINTILIFIVNILLLFIIKSDNYIVYVIAYIFAYYIYWIFLEHENNKIFGNEHVKGNKKYLIRDIKTGFFLMTGNFCNVIFTSIDRLFVKFFLGTIKFAFYSFVVSIENIMDAFISPISTVLYNYLCVNSEKEKVIKIKELVLIFATIIVAIAFPVKFIVDTWIPKYTESLSVLFILTASEFISLPVRCVHINLYKSEKQQNKYFGVMVLMILLSIVSNLVFYFIYNSMEMIAWATLLTDIVWFVIGEFNFKKYILNIKDYIYLTLIMIIFFGCGMFANGLFGLLIFAAISLVIAIILLPDACMYLYDEVKEFINKFVGVNHER